MWNPKTGSAQTHEAADQRTWKAENRGDVMEKMVHNVKEGQPNTPFFLDTKDEETLKRKVAAAERVQREPEDFMGQEHQKRLSKSLGRPDPLYPEHTRYAEPSQKVKVDAELQRDDEQYMKEKAGVEQQRRGQV